jgi:hypothetical protein
MYWYVAHLLFSVRLKERTQDFYPLWENIYLLEACDDEEANRKAREIAIRYEKLDDGFTCDGFPAELKFEGIRRLRLCDVSGKPPIDGTELTYLNMEVANQDDIRRMIIGEPTRLIYENYKPEKK